MPKHGRKIIPSRKERFLKLLKSHGVKAAAAEVGIGLSTAYKIIRECDHYKELSETALAIEGSLEKYRQSASCIGSPHKLGKMLYEQNAVAILAGIDIIDREKASDLLAHLRGEFAELEDIDDWSELEDDKITPVLINRLILKASRKDFKDKCAHCPK